MNSRPLRRLVALLLSLTFLASFAAHAFAQKRDHLTPEEIEIVRDTQELDKRTTVFVKAAERRMLALTDPAAAAKQAAKDAEKMGELKGTRTQLLRDVTEILEEAVTNIDDTALRSSESPLLKKSLRKLAEAANRFLPQLAQLRDHAQDEPERAAAENAIATAQEILEAAQKHPDEKDEKEKAGKTQTKN